MELVWDRLVLPYCHPIGKYITENKQKFSTPFWWPAASVAIAMIFAQESLTIADKNATNIVHGCGVHVWRALSGVNAPGTRRVSV